MAIWLSYPLPFLGEIDAIDYNKRKSSTGITKGSAGGGQFLGEGVGGVGEEITSHDGHCRHCPIHTVTEEVWSMRIPSFTQQPICLSVALRNFFFCCILQILCFFQRLCQKSHRKPTNRPANSISSTALRIITQEICMYNLYPYTFNTMY